MGRSAAILLAAGALAACLVPADGAIAAFMHDLRHDKFFRIGGDVDRTLSTVQQFGDLATSLIIGLVIFIQDPARRARLLDWAAGALATAGIVKVLKMAFGRPRPLHDSPTTFLGPFQTWPIKGDHHEPVPTHAYEFWKGSTSEIWSMPSSHTSAAFALAVALACLYPRLRWLVLGVASVVAFARCYFGAHYASDLVIGAGVGYVVTTLAMQGGWGRWLARVPREDLAKP